MTDLTDKQLLQATFDEVGTVKEELTGFKAEVNEFKTEVNDRFEEMGDQMAKNQEETNKKLDKILEVVSGKLATHHKRIIRLEDHLGLQTLM